MIGILFVQASLLIGLTLGATRLMRSLSAATRSVCWTALGMTLLVLPVAARIAPGITVPVSDAVPAWVVSPAPTASPATDVRVSRMLTSPAPRADKRSFASNVPIILLGIWLLGATLLASGFGRAVLHVRGIRSRARVAGGALRQELAHAAATLGVTRRVRLAATSEIHVPMTGGVIRPYVLLPANCGEWEPARLRAALLHELAHVARWDYARHLVFEAVRAMYWPNPLVWMATTREAAERELAADDRVVSAGTPANAYAAHLLAFATAAQVSPQRAAMGLGSSPFKLRIQSILGSNVPRDVPTWHAVAAIAVVAALGLTFVSSLSAARRAGAANGRVAALAVVTAPLVMQPVVARAAHTEGPPTVGDPRTDSLLAVLFLDQGLDRRVAAARALQSTGSDDVVPVLVSSLSEGCHSDRYRAARALRELRDDRAIPDLVRQLMADRHSAVRAMLVNAIATSGVTEGAALLQSEMVGQSRTSFDRVARAIETLGETTAHARLVDALRHARRARDGA